MYLVRSSPLYACICVATTVEKVAKFHELAICIHTYVHKYIRNLLQNN